MEALITWHLPLMWHGSRGENSYHPMPSSSSILQMGWGAENAGQVVKQEQLDPQLIQELIEGLCAWRNGEGLATNLSVTQQQTCIGWDTSLDGWLGREWQATQAAYWAQWQRQKSSKWWMVELIKKLWNISWDMWDDHNEALHNSPKYQDNIQDSWINEQVKEPFSHGTHAVPQDAFVFLAALLKTYYRNLSLTRNNGWDQLRWQSNERNNMNMVHISQSNSWCTDGLDWMRPNSMAPEADSGHCLKLHGSACISDFNKWQTIRCKTFWSYDQVILPCGATHAEVRWQ